MNLSPALCEKIEGIVERYIRDNAPEWDAFRKQQKMMRGNLRTKWAEVSGVEGAVIRELMQMPETLFALLKVGLTDAEYLEFQEDKYKVWFANRFPDCRTAEGKL